MERRETRGKPGNLDEVVQRQQAVGQSPRRVEKYGTRRRVSRGIGSCCRLAY
jgi:hypothetical protein